VAVGAADLNPFNLEGDGISREKRMGAHIKHCGARPITGVVVEVESDFHDRAVGLGGEDADVDIIGLTSR